jgi:N-acetylmuramoyl-L-alanine amidase
MSSLVLLLVLGAAQPPPTTVTVVTPGGELRFAVREEPEVGPLLAAAPILAAIRAGTSTDGVWAEIQLGGPGIRFLIGAPFVTVGDRLYPLATPAVVRRDTLFLPLQFVSDILPRHASGRFRYDARAARLIDTGAPTVVASTAGVPAAPANAWGLRRTHRVTVDPGHGGPDPGTNGLHFPGGRTEKHITLEVGLLLRNELGRRGIEVTMTRTRDTLIDLRHRGRYCTDQCDLFVSLHVNALPRRSGYTSVRGFETYFLAQARTEDAARVARMENEAVRFEQPSEETEALAGLDFILKDLQLNEHLRESARAAQLVQQHLGKAHDGDNRGVKQAGFMVLTTARRPAILVELGYATNRQDSRLLSDTPSQKRLAVALADAITEYLVEWERRSDTGTVARTRGRD